MIALQKHPKNRCTHTNIYSRNMPTYVISICLYWYISTVANIKTHIYINSRQSRLIFIWSSLSTCANRPIRQVTSDDDMPSRNDRAPNRFGTSLQLQLQRLRELASVYAYTSWWFQPLWNMLVKLDHFPKVRGENKKDWKPPPSIYIYKYICVCACVNMHMFPTTFFTFLQSES